MRIAAPISLTKEEQEKLNKIVRSHNASHKLVKRAKIILEAAKGLTNETIGEKLSLSQKMITLWRNNFFINRLDGLNDKPKSGRPRTVRSPEKVAEVIHRTLIKPEGMTHWSTRNMGKETGISHSSVHRIWENVDLKPHRIKTFKYSKDPLLEQKIVDVVGLYLNPPENALVISVDEKSQIQALERTRPPLAMKPGSIERQTHDYKRHGTITLFGALKIATGEAIGECYPKHRNIEFRKFLNKLNKEIPTGEIHLIMDNYGTHKHENVEKWFSLHPRFHRHFTPTSASWMNMIEIWFGILTRKALKRSSFDSVASLVGGIKAYLDVWNRHPKPFVWTKTSDEILAKAKPKIINRTSDT